MPDCSGFAPAPLLVQPQSVSPLAATAPPTPAKPLLSRTSATAIVIANIIGTGIFTTTGFLAADLPSPFAILFIWLTGGVLALCGALCYGELAAALPRSGGEYNFLSQLYHPSLGFLAGFISLTAGFAAPIAASALAFGSYAHAVLPGLPPVAMAAGLVLTMTLLHGISLHVGSRVQNVFTLLKVLLIVGFILAGITITPNPQPLNLIPGATDWQAVLSAGFAVGLVYVSFSYSGWNAAAYLAGDIRDPQRNVPRALLTGTLVVMALYLAVNFVFLYAAPISALAGQPEVGDVAAKAIFGSTGGRIVSALIALALVSSVSSMVMAGPRVMQAMGEDLPAFRLLGRRAQNGVPVYALLLQSSIALLIVMLAGLREVLQYIGVTLSLFAFLTVLGVYVLRAKQAKTGGAPAGQYRTWGYPVTPALFLMLSGWMIYHQITSAASGTGLWVLVTLAVGMLAYFALRRVR